MFVSSCHRNSYVTRQQKRRARTALLCQKSALFSALPLVSLSVMRQLHLREVVTRKLFAGSPGFRQFYPGTSRRVSRNDKSIASATVQTHNPAFQLGSMSRDAGHWTATYIVDKASLKGQNCNVPSDLQLKFHRIHLEQLANEKSDATVSNNIVTPVVVSLYESEENIASFPLKLISPNYKLLQAAVCWSFHHSLLPDAS